MDIVASCDLVIMNLILHNVEDTVMQFFSEVLGLYKNLLHFLLVSKGSYVFNYCSMT